MTTAFVLSGGASLGAVQAGMLEALEEAGIRPDLYVGASVGALNAAWMASHPERGAAAKLAQLWTGLRREDVFPATPMQLGLAFLARRQHLIAPDRLRALVEESIPARRLQDLAIPLHVVATDVTTGENVLLSRGELVPALLASAAVPAVFPPVRWRHRWLVDGGVADNTPISKAVELGADVIYVLPCGYACALARPPATALGMLLQSLTLLVQQRLAADVARFESVVELHVLPPLCPLAVSPADFGHAAELIERARTSTRRWLRGPAPRRDHHRVLAFHPPHSNAAAGHDSSTRDRGVLRPKGA